MLITKLNNTLNNNIIDKKTYHTDKPKTIIVINWLTRNNSDTN